MRRRVEPSSQTRDRWLVSYADLLTLLLAFFVVLFAESQKNNADPDGQASNVLRQALQSFTRAGVTDPAPNQVAAPVLEERAAEERALAVRETAARAELDGRMRRLLSAEIAHGSVSVSERAGVIVLSLSEAGFYRSGSAEMQIGSGVVVHRIAGELRRSRCDIRIEGHTDSTPIQNALYRSNWELSTARATGLVRRYIEQEGIPAERLSAAGYAQFHPVAPETTVQGRARNRRVDMVLYGFEDATGARKSDAFKDSTASASSEITSRPPAPLR
ncbi:MAG: OmpA family protein [Acidobacteriaceae bacterium]